MSIKAYFLEKSKIFELFCLLIILLFLPLSESIKQIFFGLLILTFIVTKILEKNIHFDYVAKGLFIFLTGNTIPIFFSAEPNLAFKWTYNIFMFSAIYLVLINEFKSEKQINLIKTFFLIGLFIGLLWGIFIWKIAWAKPRLEIHSIGAPNATGTYLGICVLFIIGILSLQAKKLYHQNVKIFIFYIILLGLLIIALILNGSRGMYVGLLSALTYLSVFFFLKKRKITFFLFLIIILISLSIGGIIYPELSNRLFDTASLIDRFSNWERSFNCFMINPITGGGSKTCYEDPDNLFLALLSKSGVIGFLSFIFLILCFLRQFSKNKYLVAMLIFILFNGIFETSLKHEPAITFLLTLFLMNNESIDS